MTTIQEKALEELAAHGIPIEGTSAQARDKEQVRIETITPKKALQYLAANSRNRDFRRDTAAKYEGILERGEGKLTTDCVGFDYNGVLINGQHRLMAICISGVPMRLGVMRGLEPEAQDVTDMGLRRALADALKMRGEKHYAELGAGLRFTHRLNYIWDTGKVHYPGNRMAPTPPESLAWLKGHPDIRDILPKIKPLIHEVPIRSGVAVAIWYNLRILDPIEADMFFDSLRSGASLAEDDAIFVVRRQLVNDARKTGAKMEDYREAALILIAWNLWREQKPVTSPIQYMWGPKRKDAFPLPK